MEPGIYQGAPDDRDSKKSIPARIIRTMKSDSEEAIKNQKETTVSIAIAEKKKQEKALTETLEKNKTTLQKTQSSPKRIGRFLIILAILFVIAILVLSYLFILPKIRAIKLPQISIPSFGTSAPIATTTETAVLSFAPSIIPIQSETRLDSTHKEQMFVEIAKETRQGLPPGEIKNLYITENNDDVPVAIITNKLLSLANVSVPDILARSLEKKFMMGLFGDPDREAVPFFILKVSGHDTGLAGMLEWEATLPRFFDSMFGVNINDEIIKNMSFTDVVVAGEDARYFQSRLGGTIVYAFANKNTIVMAGSKTTLESILPLAAKN